MSKKLYIKNLDLFGLSEDDINKKEPVKNINVHLVNENSLIVQSGKIKCCLNSIYDTRSEIVHLVKNMPIDSETVILFGLGNGEILKYINNHCKTVIEVIIIEPNVTLLTTLFNTYDFTFISDLEFQTSIYINETVNSIAKNIYAMFKKIRISKLAMITQISYASLFNAYYNEFNTILIDGISLFRISMFTRLIHEYGKCNKNILTNLEKKFYKIEDVCEYFYGKTFLLVMAGPSLNKNIKYINSAKTKCIVCAVGSAIKILESHNIEPHLRFAMDASELEYNYFKNLKDKKIPLIFGSKLEEKILNEYSENIIHFTSRGNNLESYLIASSKTERKDFITGYSIANLALEVACDIFKAKHVVLVGQDLSTKLERYAAGSGNNSNINKDDKRYIKTKNIYGEDVFTEKPYLAMKKIQEAHIARYSGVKVTNATEGGLFIKGTENLRLVDVLSTVEDHNFDFADEINTILLDNYDNRITYELEINLLNKQVNGVSNEINELSNLLHGLDEDLLVRNMSSEIKKLQTTIFNSEIISSLLLLESRDQIYLYRNSSKLGYFNEWEKLTAKDTLIYLGIFSDKLISLKDTWK